MNDDITVTDAPLALPVRALFDKPMELRDATEKGTLGTMHGYMAVFNEWTEIDSAVEGHFLERVAPGAFRKTFAEGLNRIRCIFHHGNDAAVGFRVLGPVRVLEEQENGAYAEVPLLDTSYNRDLEPGIRAGLYGMSFRFRALRQDIDRNPRKSDYNPKRLTERTLTELAVPEFGPTPFAAYVGAQAGMRSMTDDLAVETLVARGRIVLPAGYTIGSENSAGTADATTAAEAPVSASAARAATREVVGTTTRIVRERLYERAVGFAVTHPWAMEPTSLSVVLAILQERSAGEWPSQEEIHARLGLRALALPMLPGDDDEDDDVPDNDPVALIPVYGPIVPHAGMLSMTSSQLASAEGIGSQLRAALADDSVTHIVFDIDSPGGQVSLIPELAAEILAARGQKPMIAVANTLMASAAYWIGAMCDEVVASPSADVGSVGVYSAHQDLTKAMEEAGVKTTIVTSEGSPFKAEFSPFVELSEAAEEEMQNRADSIMDNFVAALAQARGTTTDDVLANFGQGRCLMAADALKAGMVDRIGTLDSVLAQLHDGAAAPASDGAEPDEDDEPQAVSEPAPDVLAVAHPGSARRGLDPHTLLPKEEPEWLL
jgi:capsid assembly protease